MNHPHAGRNRPKTTPLRTGARAMAVPVLLLALALFVPLSAQCQEQEDGPFLTLETGLTGEAEFDESRAGVGASSLAVEGGWDWLTLRYQRTDYSWSDKEDLPFGDRSHDPWDTLQVIALASEHNGMFNQDWGWIAGLEVSAAFEEELSGSLGVSAYGGGVYMISDQTMVTFGLGLSAHETGLDFLPLLMVGWDGVGQDGSGWFGGLGIPQTMLGYSFSERFSLALELGMDGTTYRLADDSTVWSKGYVEHDEMDLSLAATWHPLENLSVTLAPSYRFGRSMTIYDEDGEKQDSHDLDNTWGLNLDLSFAF